MCIEIKKNHKIDQTASQVVGGPNNSGWLVRKKNKNNTRYCILHLPFSSVILVQVEVTCLNLSKYQIHIIGEISAMNKSENNCNAIGILMVGTRWFRWC